VTEPLLRHPESVTVIALVDGDVLLVSQPRPGAPDLMLELPAGKLEGDETPRQAAARELREECGWTASSFEEIGAFWAAPGYSTERVHVLVAVQAHPDERGDAPDADERIEVVRRPLPDLPGCLTDGISIAAFALWRDARERADHSALTDDELEAELTVAASAPGRRRWVRYQTLLMEQLVRGRRAG
jgi:8-oxo-dGTP pyrophosphatase MutT (NUDIX family)